MYFPEVENADEDGILAVGGEVTPTLILDAITHGVFPWPISFGDGPDDEEGDYDEVDEFDVAEEDYPVDEVDDEYETPEESDEVMAEVEYESQDTPQEMISLNAKTLNACWNDQTRGSLETLASSNSVLAWWAPDPRAIFDLDNIHIPRRLQRTMRSGKFVVTFDQVFPAVMLACATAGMRKQEGTWITQEFFDGYCKLHELGYAHSAECWLVDENGEMIPSVSGGVKGRLVGGVYGVAINGFFDGESMFSTETDASKVALFTLLTRLRHSGFKLFDLQILNEHTKSLGGVEIPRKEYQKRLCDALQTYVKF